jgi:hypothetical protein
MMMTMSGAASSSLALFFVDHCCRGFGSPAAEESLFFEIAAMRFVSFDDEET